MAAYFSEFAEYLNNIIMYWYIFLENETNGEKHHLSSPINTVFCLRIFCQNANVVEYTETHRKILLSMVTRWSETIQSHINITAIIQNKCNKCKCRKSKNINQSIKSSTCKVPLKQSSQSASYE